MRDPILNRNMMFEFNMKKILNENFSMRKGKIYGTSPYYSVFHGDY